MNKITQLEKLCGRFSGLIIEKKGVGASQFIYARTEKKTFELSLDPPFYFVEGWNCADPESEDDSIFSEQIGTLSELEKRIRDWIT